jgi:hypothetical protein
MKFDDLKSAFEAAPEGVYTATFVQFVDQGERNNKFGSSSRQAHYAGCWTLSRQLRATLA